MPPPGFRTTPCVPARLLDSDDPVSVACAALKWAEFFAFVAWSFRLRRFLCDDPVGDCSDATERGLAEVFLEGALHEVGRRSVYEAIGRRWLAGVSSGRMPYAEEQCVYCGCFQFASALPLTLCDCCLRRLDARSGTSPLGRLGTIVDWIDGAQRENR